MPSRHTLHTRAKGRRVLEALETAGHGLTLTEVARRQRQSQTAAFRLLKTLADHGHVRQDAVTECTQLEGVGDKSKAEILWDNCARLYTLTTAAWPDHPARDGGR
jgi:hypothetical protein